MTQSSPSDTSNHHPSMSTLQLTIIILFLVDQCDRIFHVYRFYRSRDELFLTRQFFRPITKEDMVMSKSRDMTYPCNFYIRCHRCTTGSRREGRCAIHCRINFRNHGNSSNAETRSRGTNGHTYQIQELTHIGISYISVVRWWKFRTTTVVITDMVHMIMTQAK